MQRKLIVMQRDARDCGVCSLLSIIKYYGGYVPIEKLRMDTYTNNSGTTFYHLIQTLQKYGFEATGMKTNIDNLMSGDVRLPVLVHLVLKNNLTHFAVLYKITKNVVEIMDPARGAVKMAKSEFLEIWTKAILIINPIQKIVTIPKDKSIINLFIKILPLEKKLIIKMIITSLCLMFFSIIYSFYFKISIEEINKQADLMTFLTISLIFLLMILLKVFLKYIRNHYENYLNKNVDIRIIMPFIKHIFLLPLNIVKSRQIGEITSRISDLNQIKSLFSKIFVTVLLDLLLAIVAMFVLCQINSRLFFILCLTGAIYFIIGLILNPIIYKKIMTNIEKETDFNSNLIENIDGILTIKNANQTDFVLDNIENKLLKYLREVFNLNNFLNAQNVVKDFINEIGLFAITCYGMYLILVGRINIVDLITFNTLLVYFIEPIKAVCDLLPAISHLKATILKVSEFANLEIEKIEKKSEEFKNGKIKLENLSFSYNNYDYLLKDVNLEIEMGSKTFIKGPSGCGKSTICKLLYRLIENQHGNITIDNINIKDYQVSTIRENITYLAQKERLFTDTIRNNIVFGRKFSTEVLTKILSVCRVDEIIDSKPLRLETMLLDGGFNFSGGERQRIALARALAKKSKILILDEALSEVSAELEREIIKDIKNTYKEQTIIYISHRNNERLFNKVIDLGALNAL